MAILSSKLIKTSELIVCNCVVVARLKYNHLPQQDLKLSVVKVIVPKKVLKLLQKFGDQLVLKD